jgi:hypothetical protein
LTNAPSITSPFANPFGNEVPTATAYDCYFDTAGNGLFRSFSESSSLKSHPILSQLSKDGQEKWLKYFTKEKKFEEVGNLRKLVRGDPGYISQANWILLFNQAQIPENDQKKIFEAMRKQMLLELEENSFFSASLSSQSIEKLADYLQNHEEARSNFNKFLVTIEIVGRKGGKYKLSDEEKNLLNEFISLLEKAEVPKEEQKACEELIGALNNWQRLIELFITKRCVNGCIGTWDTKNKLPLQKKEAEKPSSDPIHNPGAGVEDVSSVPGIALGHSYEIVGTTQKKGETYVRVRNPWGEHGATYDAQGQLTLDRKAGEFDLKLEDFIQYGEATTWRMPYQ